MKRTLLFFLVLILALPAVGQTTDTTVYPYDTFPFWRPGYNGGGTWTNIPYYPNCVNLTNVAGGAVGDGVTVCDMAMTNAIAACTNGGAIYLPPRLDGSRANYLFTNFSMFFTSSKQFVIRFDNMAMATCTAGKASGSRGNWAPILFGQNTSRNSPTVSSGYNRGSTSLTVSAITGLAQNQLIRFYQTDNPADVFGSLASTSIGNQCQSFLISSTPSGSSFSISSPVFWTNYTAGFNPRMDAFTSPCHDCGLENATINYTGVGDHIVSLDICYNCWLLNCTFSNAVFETVQLTDAYRNTIAWCKGWGHQTMDCTARAFYKVNEASSENLFIHSSGQIGNAIVQSQQSCGNVYACLFGDTGWCNTQGASNTPEGESTHGNNSNYELFWMNKVPWISWDEFWGDNRMNYALRNWLTRAGYGDALRTIPINQGINPAFFIDATNHFMLAVGNDMGTPRDIGDANSSHLVAEIGYARSKGNNPPSSPADPATASTLFFHGNYDFVSQSYQWSNGIPQVASNSFIDAFTTRPEFGTLQYPAAGPGVDIGIMTNQVATLPAEMFAVYGTNAMPDPFFVGSPLPAAIPVGNVTTFTATGMGHTPVTYQWVCAGTNVAGATTAAWTTPVQTQAGVLPVSVTMADASGSAQSASVNLVVVGGFLKTYGSGNRGSSTR